MRKQERPLVSFPPNIFVCVSYSTSPLSSNCRSLLVEWMRGMGLKLCQLVPSGILLIGDSSSHFLFSGIWFIFHQNFNLNFFPVSWKSFFSSRSAFLAGRSCPIQLKGNKWKERAKEDRLAPEHNNGQTHPDGHHDGHGHAHGQAGG